MAQRVAPVEQPGVGAARHLGDPDLTLHNISITIRLLEYQIRI